MGKIIKFLDYITSLGGKAPDMLTRYLRFGVVTGLVFLTQLILLSFLVEFFQIVLLISTGIAFAYAYITGYVLTRKWSYKGTEEKIVKSFIFFIVIGIIGIFFVSITTTLITEYTQTHYIISRSIAGLIIGIFCFIANYFVSFRMRKYLNKNLR